MIFPSMKKLTRELLRRRGRAARFYHFNIDLEGGPCLQKRLTGCGAGHEYLAVANGDLYPCHQFVGRSEYLMGNVFNGRVRPDLVDAFRRARYNRRAVPAAGPGFTAAAAVTPTPRRQTVNLQAPRTGLQPGRKRLECALYLKLQESRQNYK